MSVELAALQTTGSVNHSMSSELVVRAVEESVRTAVAAVPTVPTVTSPEGGLPSRIPGWMSMIIGAFYAKHHAQ